MVSKKANNNTKCTAVCEIVQKKLKNLMLVQGYTQAELANKIGSLRQMQMQRYARGTGRICIDETTNSNSS